MGADAAYRNARQNTPTTARVEHDRALANVMLSLLKDDSEIYKQFVQNEAFKRFVTDMVYGLTNQAPVPPGREAGAAAAATRGDGK